MQTKFFSRIAPFSTGCMFAMILAGCLHGPSRWDHRHQSLKQSLQILSEDPEQVHYRAWANFMLGDNWRQSAEDFSRTATNMGTLAAPDRQLAWLGRGMLHLAQADFQKANEAFVSSIELDPQGIYAWASAIQLQESAHQVPNGHAAIEARLQSILDQGLVEPQTRRTLTIILLQAHKRSGRISSTPRSASS